MRSLFTAVVLCICLHGFLGSVNASGGKTAQRDFIYVTNERDGRITVIDAIRDSVIGNFMVGGRPRGIRATKDGRTLFVAVSKPGAVPKVRAKEYDFIVAVDISHAEPLSAKVMKLYNAGSDPEQLDLSRDEKYFVVANEDAGTASIIEISSGKRVAELIAGLEPEGVRASPDGKVVYVTSEAGNTVSVVDLHSRSITHSFLVGARPRDVAFCSQQHKAYVSNEHSADLTVIDTRKHEIMRSIALPKGSLPMSVQVSPDGKRLYASTGRGNAVVVVDCAADTVLGLVKTGNRTWGIALNSDGSKLYAANSLENTVSIIDTRSLSVSKTLRVGDGPWGMVCVRR